MRLFFISLALLLVSAEAQAYTIDFAPLSPLANTAPYVGHSQGGFTVTPTQGQWFVAQQFGNPIPDIYGGPIGTPSISSVSITGGLFTFTSFSASSNVGPSTYLVTGFRSGSQVLTGTGGLAGTSSFNTIASPNPAATIDSLTIQISPGSGATSSFNLDNIVVNPVPEPEALAAIGIAAMGFVRRKR